MHLFVAFPFLTFITSYHDFGCIYLVSTAAPADILLYTVAPDDTLSAAVPADILSRAVLDDTLLSSFTAAVVSADILLLFSSVAADVSTSSSSTAAVLSRTICLRLHKHSVTHARS